MKSLRRWAGPAVAVAVLGFVVWRIGTGPFIVGLEAVVQRIARLTHKLVPDRKKFLLAAR